MTPSCEPLVQALGMAFDSVPDQPEDLREMLGVLRRRKWLLALLIAGLPTIAYLLSASSPKVYSANAIVQVQGTAVDTSLFAPGAVTSQAGVIAAAARLVKTQQVAQAAAQRLVPPPYNGLKDLIDAVSATSESETGFVTIVAESRRADRAAQIANAFAGGLVEVRSTQARAQVSETIDGIARQREELARDDRAGRLSLSAELQRLQALRAAQNRNAVIVEPAAVPDSPASPKPLRNAAMAFILAVLMSVALAFLIERLDPRIRRPEQLRRLAALPVLGLLPRVHGSKRVAALHESDAIQSLRASLSYFDVDEGVRSVVVASPGNGEGKTTVAVNLALSLAGSGRNVILIDADLRRPAVAQRLGLPHGDPVTEVSVAGGRLRVLRTEARSARSTKPLDPERMRTLVRTAEGMCDFVVVDGTALLPVSDLVSILRDVSGVILLARMNRTSRDSVARALEIVQLAGGTVLGFVATYVPRGAGDRRRRMRRLSSPAELTKGRPLPHDRAAPARVPDRPRAQRVGSPDRMRP
jgi:capsular polysaccharide biosynthesis protein